jgi:hypothetical protein
MQIDRWLTGEPPVRLVRPRTMELPPSAPATCLTDFCWRPYVDGECH